jgi:hypothetical protein
VAEKVGHLETFYDGITSCHVYIRAPHQSQRQGNLYEVTIEVRVPGEELVVRTTRTTWPNTNTCASPCATPSPRWDPS